MKGNEPGGEKALSRTTEPLREMVSALVDGEASDFEIRRLLDSLEDPEVRGLVERHYTVRAVMRREASALCPPELTAAVLAALHDEAPLAASGAVARWRTWAGGAAVAASVCLVTVLGTRMLADAGSPAGFAGNAVAASGMALGSLGAPAMVPMLARGGAMPVGLGSPLPPAGSGADRAAELRLRMFMLDHAQNASFNGPQGMIPFVRVDSGEQP